MNNKRLTSLSKVFAYFLFLMVIEISFNIAVASRPPTHPANLSDPYEGFNRVMFNFNEELDRVLLKPVATLYNKIVPKPLNEGIHNFLNNLNSLPTIANDVLQLNMYQATNDVWRLVINTTLGVGGFFDVAERMQLHPYNNDFGLTLAKWGYTKSSYLVLPFFGPNTLRDGIEIPVDYYAFSIYPHIQPLSLRLELYGLGVVDDRVQLLQYQAVMDEIAFDKYVFVRNAYLQRRAYQIEQTWHRGYADQLHSSTQSKPPPENYDVLE